MDPFSNPSSGGGPGAEAGKRAARSSSEAEAATAKWLKTGKELSRWVAGFIVETAVFGAATKVLTRQIEDMRRGLQAAREVEDLKKQFKALGGGASEAARRVKELTNISKNSRFNIQELGKAEIALDVLSKGALAGGRNLRQLAAIAQDTGKPVDALAGSVGDLYGALAEGRPIADTAEELTALGAITPDVAKEIDRLQQSGAGLAATWRVVEQSLAQAESRASHATKTLSDLEAKRANVEGARDVAVGDQFLEGRKASERASTTLTSATSGAAVDAIRPLAALYNGIMTAKEGVVNFITSWKGLGTAITTVAQIFQAVFLVVLLSSAKGMIQLIGSIGIGIIRFTGLGRSVAAAAAAIRAMSLAMRLTTGAVGILATALAFAVIKVAEHAQKLQEARKAAEDSADATLESADAIRKQADAIATLRDRSEAQIAALEKLAEAQRAYAAAKAATAQTKEGTPERDNAINAEAIAANNVEAIKRTYEEISQIKADSLSADREALDLAIQRYQIEKQIREQQQDAIVARTSVDKRTEAIKAQIDGGVIKTTSADGKIPLNIPVKGINQQISDAERFQSTLQSDTLKYDPLKRALDLAKKGGDPAVIAKAQAAADAFRNDPSRNANFKLSQDIADREEARANLNQLSNDKEHKIADRTSTQADVDEADRKLKAGKADIVKRFGSLEAISPAAVSQLDQQRKKNEINNDVNSLVQRKGALNSQLRGAGDAAKEAKDETDLAEMRAAAERTIISFKEKGYDLAVQEAQVKKQANALEIAQLQKRLGDPRYNDAETKNSIAALQNDSAGIDKGLALQREEGLRTKRGAEAEIRARKLEAAGADEAAARVRESAKIEERILQLREEGLTKEEATKQARDENHQDRLDRNRSRNQGGDGIPTIAEDFYDPTFRTRRANEQIAKQAINSIQVDSMTGIGGNQGGAAGDGPTSLLRQILQELRRANRGDVRDPSLNMPKWDDDQRRQPGTPY